MCLNWLIRDVVVFIFSKWESCNCSYRPIPHRRLKSCNDNYRKWSMGIRKFDSCYDNTSMWYDNEWGYSNRVVDLVRYISKK